VPRGAELSPVRVGFSVPKKKFKSSVKRHRVRRLMVEAWRLQKNGLYEQIPADRQLHIFLLYTDIVLPTQELVTTCIGKAIERLVENLKPADA
jgi:ribonuclease P protein component